MFLANYSTNRIISEIPRAVEINSQATYPEGSLWVHPSHWYDGASQPGLHSSPDEVNFTFSTPELQPILPHSDGVLLATSIVVKERSERTNCNSWALIWNPTHRVTIDRIWHPTDRGCGKWLQWYPRPHIAYLQPWLTHEALTDRGALRFYPREIFWDISNIPRSDNGVQWQKDRRSQAFRVKNFSHEQSSSELRTNRRFDSRFIVTSSFLWWNHNMTGEPYI